MDGDAVTGAAAEVLDGPPESPECVHAAWLDAEGPFRRTGAARAGEIVAEAMTGSMVASGRCRAGGSVLAQEEGPLVGFGGRGDEVGRR